MSANGGDGRKSNPMLISALIAVLVVGVVTLTFASMRVSREIDQSAETTGSSTIPKDPGSNMDRTRRTGKDDPKQMHQRDDGEHAGCDRGEGLHFFLLTLCSRHYSSPPSRVGASPAARPPPDAA